LDALYGAEKIIQFKKPIIFIEIEELHLRKFHANSKILIEKILSMGYVLYRIESEYPCDHLCIPLEEVSRFEKDIINKFSFRLSKIEGRNVELRFLSIDSQNYDSCIAVK